MNEEITNELKPLLGNVIEGIDASELELLDKKLDETGIENEDDDEESDSDEDDEHIPEWTKREIFVTSLSTILVVLSIGNILFTPFEVRVSMNSFIFDAFTILGLFIPIYSAYQEQKVTEAKEVMKKAKKYKERMQRYVKDIHEHQVALKKMEKSTSNLEELKGTLEEVRKFENASLEELEKSLETKKDILKMSDNNLAAKAVDNIFDVVMASNQDGNEELSKDEIDKIIKTTEGLYNVDLNDKIVREKIKKYGLTESGIMRFVDDIFRNDPSFTTVLEK